MKTINDVHVLPLSYCIY